MYLNDVERVISICIQADVVPEIVGHRGIGKTQLVRQVGRGWKDRWMSEDQEGIPVISLYCATQDVADLIGFPIKMWKSDGAPVVLGIASNTPNDSIITSWAEPEWVMQLNMHCAKTEESDVEVRKQMIKDEATDEELYLFWNRPKCIVFLDEIKRAPREVLMAMYPFLLDKTLHMHVMPRGTRIVTADNFAGSYDLREPDEAFMSRSCHIEAECDIKTWNVWATKAGVHLKIRSFLTSNPPMLIQVPKDQEEASIHYQPIPDPRRWGDMINRIEKYGRHAPAVINISPDMQDHSIKQAIRGVCGNACTEAYWKHSDAMVSMIDILEGKMTLKSALTKFKSDTKANQLKEKIQIEAQGTLKDREFNAKEAERLLEMLEHFDSRERATAVLQVIFTMKNNNELDEKWIKVLMKDAKVTDIIDHLMKRKNV